MAFYDPKAPIFVPSTSPTSIGVGIGSLNDDTTGTGNVAIGDNSGGNITTGSNNVVLGNNVASTTLATGSNNIVIGTSSAADTASASTSNTLWIGGGSTAVLSATGINGTPVVTIPGSLVVTGGVVNKFGAISTAQLDKTSDTALAAVTGLSIPGLVAGGTYLIEGYLVGTSGVSGGWKVSLDTSDTLTATSISYTANLNTAAGAATASTTTLGTGVGSTAAVVNADIMGTIVVNAGGTLILKFAQNASNGTASSIYVNSWLRATRIS